MEPFNIPVFCPPCHLPFGIAPRISLYQLNGFIPAYLPVEIHKKLLVSHGVKSIVMTVWQHTARFLLQPLIYHYVYPPVDSFIQFLPVHAQSSLKYFKIPVPALSLKEPGIRGACCFTYLQGPQYSFMVPEVYLAVIIGVQHTEGLPYTFKAFFFIFPVILFPDPGINIGYIVNTATGCIYIQSGSTGH